MAKTKEEKLVNQQIENENVEEVKVAEAPVKTGPSYEELMAMVQQLAQEVQNLKSAPVAPAVTEVAYNDKTDRLLEALTNRKSDKEIVIVHNREMLGGLCTAINLTGLNIESRTLGEQRVLNWQQFEECVSKYRRFFDLEIILLGDEYAEVAERYSVPCIKRGNNHTCTREELAKLPKMDIRELEDFFMSLTVQDKEFVCSYWLGKCYEKKEGFYDRYKVELLNRLSNSHIFDNLLTLMNGDFRAETK
jgi:hypothetical protein